MRAHNVRPLIAALFISMFLIAVAAAPASAVPDDVVITSGPQDGDTVNKSVVSITWQLAANPIGMVACYLDDSYFPNCFPTAFMALNDGVHSFRMVSFGVGGPGGDADRTIHFTVDTTPPPLTVASGPAQGATLYKKQAAFVFTSETGAKIECSLDGAAASDCTAGMKIDPVKVGLHVLAVTAIDKVGNSASITRYFVGSSLLGRHKRSVKFCYRVKKTRGGKVVKKRGKVVYRKVCRRATITY